MKIKFPIMNIAIASIMILISCKNINKNVEVVDDIVEYQMAFENTPFYLDDNGVTVKVKENYFAQKQNIIGTEVIITYNDEETIYNIADEKLLREMIANEINVEHTVTTFITDMSDLFEETIKVNKNYNLKASAFSDDISSWDTSNVIDMSGMFAHVWLFFENISHWNTSKVTDMSKMFYDARSFKSDISSWDTSNVTNMSEMFAIYGMSLGGDMNEDISKWNSKGECPKDCVNRNQVGL